MNASGGFNPSGIGTFDNIYTYTDANGCVNSDTMTITVIDPTNANAGLDFEVCVDTGAIFLTGLPFGGTWSGNGILPGGYYGVNIDGSFDFIYNFGIGNCLTTDTVEVIIHPLPIVNCGNDFSLCISNSDTVLSASPIGGFWYNSNFIDSLTGNFSPSNAGVGIHELIYQYINPITHCLNSDTISITINPLPIPSFSFDSIICINNQSIFNNQSVNSFNNYWEISNGFNSNNQNLTYTFSDTGFFDIKLINESSYGCYDSITESVQVIKPPSAIISLIDSGCGPLLVDFNNSSQGNYLNFQWDLGNGQSSIDSLPDPVLYLSSVYHDTTYYITLIVNNLCGIDTAFDSVLVNPSPSSIFATDLDIKCSPDPFLFIQTSYGNPDNFYWDFGDSSFAIYTDSSSSSGFQHVYYYNGQYDTTYTISLITENECGSDTSYHTITVLPNQVYAFFNTNLTSGCVPLDVDFTQYTTPNVSFSWDFGDGNFSTQYSPTHTFYNPGTFQVSFAVNDGCSYDTTYQTILVNPLPNVNFGVSDSILCEDETFYFNNNSINVSSDWSFGDGNTSSLTNPNHSYQDSGSYMVLLQVTSLINGCKNADSMELISLIKPIPNITATPSFGCMPLNVVFNNNSNNAAYFNWDFGDGNNDNFINGSHTYLNAGNFTTSIIATGLNGCQDSTSININVYPLPLSNFDIAHTDLCYPPATVNFYNNSSGANAYNWYFGNGDSSVLVNPTINYNAGTYNVILNAQNIYGCESNYDTTIIVYNTPIANFIVSEDTICLRDSVSFESISLFSDSLSWNLSNGITYSDIYFNYQFQDSGYYPITLYAYNTTGNCSDTSNNNLYVYVKNSPIADFNFINNISPIEPRAGVIEFFNQSVFADYYEWYFDINDTSTLENPVYSYSYNQDGYYSFKLIAIADNECKDSLIKQIYVSFEKGLFVPNAFCPEHTNPELRKFMPKAIGLRGGLDDYHLEIFDTYGNKIWESRLVQDGQPVEWWDGTFNGELLMQDAYVWKIKAVFKDGSIWDGKEYSDQEKVRKTGTVTLIR